MLSTQRAENNSEEPKPTEPKVGSVDPTHSNKEHYEKNVFESVKSQILTKKEVFERIFRGEQIDMAHVFTYIQGYSPTGKPKALPVNEKNTAKFARLMLHRAEEAKRRTQTVRINPLISLVPISRRHTTNDAVSETHD